MQKDRRSRSLRYRLASLSIRTRLVATIAGTVLLVVLTGGWLILQHDLSRLEQQLVDETKVASQVLAQDFARLLLLDTPDIAADVVGKLSAFTMILHADLYARDGRHALHFNRDSSDLTEVTLPEGVDQAYINDMLVLRTVIEYDRSLLGEAIFIISTDRLNARMVSIYKLLAFMLPGIVLLIFFAAYILQRTFSRPLINLAQAVHQISEGKDYKLRLTVTDASEFGQLFSGFNRMIDTIDHATHELNEQKAQLQVTLQSIADGVITTDRNGLIQYMNPVAERLCGKELEQAFGHPIDKLFRLKSYLDGLTLTNPVYQCIEQGHPVSPREDCDLVRHNGERIGIKESAAPIYDAEGQLLGTVAVLVDVSVNRAMSEELTFQASHDTLTNLLNRRAFEQQLGIALESAHQRDEQHVLFYMDLDQFKVVNDTCGHAAGDDLLKQLAGLLRSKVRSGDCLARLGGDEFGIILMHCPVDRALLISEEILSVINDFRFEWMGEVFSVGISIGMISINESSLDAQQLMANADAACYQAKDQGRNRVYIYHEEDEDLNRRRGDMAFVSRLRKVIDQGRFILYQQQIEPMETTSSKNFHYEILLRMLDENDQLVSPYHFMPAAERYGLIEQIDRWVVTNVIQQLSTHPEHLSELNCCSINLSGVSISQAEFLEFLRTQIQAVPELAPKLCMEITETATIGNMTAVTRLMQVLGEFGVKFSLDDFGTGMSSLSYLKNLPVDYVKIDGVFVRDIIDDPIDLGMVRAINELAHVMGKQTVAEFVETPQTLEMLRQIGVDFVQGYLLGKPRPLSELLDNK